MHDRVSRDTLCTEGYLHSHAHTLLGIGTNEEQMKPAPFVAQAGVDGGVGVVVKHDGPWFSYHPWWCNTHLYRLEDGGRYELKLAAMYSIWTSYPGSAYNLAFIAKGVGTVAMVALWIHKVQPELVSALLLRGCTRRGWGRIPKCTRPSKVM